jgi:IS5 family transposase
VQDIIKKASRKHAPKSPYVSPKQFVLEGFESPFDRRLNPMNRWVKLAKLIPWDDLCNIYRKAFKVKATGRPDLNPRIVTGAIIIKHLCNLDDRETVDQISENVYMQYFLGYSSFNDQKPFDPSLFVDFQKRLGLEQMNAINERIGKIKEELTDPEPINTEEETEGLPPGVQQGPTGNLIVDATACPQDIAYPTDLDLLNSSREKSEELLDVVFGQSKSKTKPRNYREIAR